jgi:membrane complex biogenesis BtpA family protein
MLLREWEKVAKPVIGMLHLLPLPGSPCYGSSMEKIRSSLLDDARKLASGGVHGLMIENFGDVPFFPARVPAEVVAHMTALAAKVKREVPQLPLGINVLRNDGLSALAVAHAAGAQFIRVNVLCGARLADQGILHGIAHELLRLRSQLGGEQIRIFADVDVKHSAPLAQRALADEVDDTVHRGLADALIVSGAGTGKPTDPGKLRQVKAAAGPAPVFLGSGVTPDTLPALVSHADGFIVGTYFKKDGISANPVDENRVRQLLRGLDKGYPA